jgi:hypothetical protein
VGGAGTLLNGAGGQITGNGGISAPVNNAGGLIFANSSSSLVISNMASANGAGAELRIADGSTLNVVNPFASSGTIMLQGANANFNGGAIDNTGTISGRGRISNPVNNSGIIRAEGGLLTLAGSNCTNNAVGSIQAPAGGTIFYSQGLATNAGTIALAGGTFDTNATAINNTGTIDGRGIFRSGGLTNSNKIAIADGPSEVYGIVVNNASITITNTTATFFNNVTNNATGTIKTTSAVSRFLGTFTNSGAFISDPSDNFFDNLAIGESGVLVGGLGDRFFVNGDVISTSRARARWSTGAAELYLQGAGVHHISVDGNDLGAIFEGYDDNFAWGTLVLGPGNRLALQDGNDEPGGALYLQRLVLGGGIEQISSISGDGLNIYYHLGDPANAYLGGQTYALAGGGQIAPVPEPASLILEGLTALLMLGRRMRNHVHG